MTRRAIATVIMAFLIGVLPSVLASSLSLDTRAASSVTVTVYSQVADGEVLRFNCNDWSTCRNGSSGTAAWSNLMNGTVEAGFYNSTYHVKRVFFYFDTSAIPANAHIDSAVLNVYAANFLQGSTSVHVVRSTANTPLSVADFNQVQFVSGGSATPTTIGWMNINLNTTALNWVIRGGTTKLALIHNLDLNNSAPSINNSLLVAFAEDSQHRPNLVVTYSTSTTGTIVTEARLDTGMPYNANRGCSSPYIGCGGPYHGFYNGVCTDLAMDAYNAGVPFNIQNILAQDHRNHPGRYRYGTARNAEDMRRYFGYNQSFLSHSQPYQPGDIAFFDWDGDGLTNHVLVISEVDASNRPLKMVDASGVIPGINPSGLAFEHSWSSYYEQHIQGHARLGSISLATTAALTETLQILRVTVNSPSVRLSLFDSNGKSVSEVYDENLVANNIETSIPYIPGGSYASLGTQKVITVTQPLSNTNQYFVRVEGQANTTYTLLIETLQDVSVTASQTFTQAIGAGETQNVGITVTAPSSVISFTAQSPTSSPVVNLPSSLFLGGLVGTSAQLTFTISETGGQQAISNASITATDLSTQYGIKILSSQLTITPTNFSVAAGSNQQVSVEVNLANLNPGEYLGSLILTSQSGSPVMIPFTLQVQYHTVYLPSIARN
jgi:hypothetical protein